MPLFSVQATVSHQHAEYSLLSYWSPWFTQDGDADSSDQNRATCGQRWNISTCTNPGVLCVVVGWERSEQCGWQRGDVKAITLFHSEVISKLWLEELEKNSDLNDSEQRFPQQERGTAFHLPSSFIMTDKRTNNQSVTNRWAEVVGPNRREKSELVYLMCKLVQGYSVLLTDNIHKKNRK